MKTSPICTRDDGRGLMFTAKSSDTKYRITLPPEMMDSVCGEHALESARRGWAQSNKLGLIENVRAKLEGTDMTAPFDQIIVEEIA